MAVVAARKVRLETILGEKREGFCSRFPLIREDIPAKPMRAGAAMLALFGVVDGWLPEGREVLPPYGCHVHFIDNARVVSSTGIVILPSNEVIEDTIDHTDPLCDRYRTSGLLLQVEASARRIHGQILSLLLGAYDNHFHWLLMSLGRLAILSDAERSMIDGILVPADLSPVAKEALRYAIRDVAAPLVPVERGTNFVVDTLILPWNVASGYGVNPDVADFFRSWGLRHTTTAPRRIYVDRRRSGVRRLLNENELVAALEKQGIEPLASEHFTLAQQIDYFAAAELIVAPHGAGLTNMVFANRTASVLELMPFNRTNWCYRNLAAACGHSYDAVFGRQTTDGRPDDWTVSVAHVISALPI